MRPQRRAGGRSSKAWRGACCMRCSRSTVCGGVLHGGGAGLPAQLTCGSVCSGTEGCVGSLQFSGCLFFLSTMFAALPHELLAQRYAILGDVGCATPCMLLLIIISPFDGLPSSFLTCRLPMVRCFLCPSVDFLPQAFSLLLQDLHLAQLGAMRAPAALRGVLKACPLFGCCISNSAQTQSYKGNNDPIRW